MQLFVLTALQTSRRIAMIILLCGVSTEFTLARVGRGRFGLIFLTEQMNDLFVQFLNYVVCLLFCP